MLKLVIIKNKIKNEFKLMKKFINSLVLSLNNKAQLLATCIYAVELTIIKIERTYNSVIINNNQPIQDNK